MPRNSREIAARMVATGLVTGEDAPAMAAEPEGADSRIFGQRLVERGALTPYQRDALIAGHDPPLARGEYVIVDRPAYSESP